MSSIQRINAEGLGKLPVFCHASIAGDFIYVSGTLGTNPESFELADGAMYEQTTQTLRNIQLILQAAGAGLQDIVKINVYVTDMQQFAEMNRAYSEILGDEPPARVTAGCAELALGALVEMDCIAYKPDRG